MHQNTPWHPAALLASPLFAPLHTVIESLGVHDFPQLFDLNGLLAQHQPPITVNSGNALQFVNQQYGKLPFEAQYEPRCYLTGAVPTRHNNWHDLLNALVWLTFPRAKAAINARHYQALMDMPTPIQTSTTSQRGAGRDAITLLDESGVIVAYADDELANNLRQFEWKELFWHQRQRVQTRMGFYLFGHGLYEKALHPYLGMTGHALLLPVEQKFFACSTAERLAYLDQRVAEYLAQVTHCQHPREFSPVPLLGVPGWAAENQNPSYYDNVAYFRAGRKG